MRRISRFGLCADGRVSADLQNAISYPADVEGVKAEVSRLAVLLVHVDDSGRQKDLREGYPEQKLPHRTLLHLDSSNTSVMNEALSRAAKKQGAPEKPGNTHNKWICG